MDKLEAFVTCWMTPKLISLTTIFTGYNTIDGSFQMGAFVGFADARRISHTSSWEGWLVDTSLEVTEEHFSAFSSITFIARKGAYFDIVVDLAVDGTVDWSESVTFGLDFGVESSGASFLSDSSHTVTEVNTSAVNSVSVTSVVFDDEYLSRVGWYLFHFSSVEFFNYFEGTVGFDPFDQKSDWVGESVFEEGQSFGAGSGRYPVWGWAAGPPGVSSRTGVRDDMAVTVFVVVSGRSVERTADTVGGVVMFSSDEDGF